MKTKGFLGWKSFNAGQKYCRMLRGSILQYLRPAWSYHLSLRPTFYLFLSGCLRQVWLLQKLKKDSWGVDGLVVKHLTWEWEVRGSILTWGAYCVLEGRYIYSSKVLVKPRKRWLCPDMTEKLFTGTSSKNKMKGQGLIHSRLLEGISGTITAFSFSSYECTLKKGFKGSSWTMHPNLQPKFRV